MDGKVVLSLQNITKRYPGVLALNNVSVDFLEGEVHALLGENGAGKSTLIKAVAGAIEIDSGTITINGHIFQKVTPHVSRSLGVEVIYQEFNLVPTLSVAENIYLCEKSPNSALYNADEFVKKASAVLAQFGVHIDPRAMVQDLSIADQQIVEIAKAVSKNVKILIMDEPSAPLSVSEVEMMFNIIRQLKARGVTVIYISHRLEEVFRISDRVTVLRDGCYITTLNTAETSRQELIKLMVGRELKESYPARKNPPGEIALEVKHLTGNGNRDISFTARAGEILGIAGLVGAGRTELAQLIFGAVPAEKGEILISGNTAQIHSPLDAIRHKIGFLTEDRKGQGLFLEMSVKWNIIFPILKNISKYGVVDTKKEDQIAGHYKDRINIKTPSLTQKVINLSGGNQQKVVLAKALAAESDILIFDEPTRGIDVGAKQEIYHLMTELADLGKTILMISSDMEELLGMSDRIIVMCEGRLAGEVQKENFDQHYILDLASGTN
ncbi:MAG: sugar ABC transporter ATP-binding protein [Chloroflexi bacterium]|nr:sugar ABC transporter ATP-binding protein [Anaerolineaceae bacterium]NLI44354.1 sugar ABC transporter ATP-binding protein [Chloroflexota bacterium]HOE34390.1 sugar ABC transporter ATP-binding protein [Anaerolineaceae bacterium]HOT25399.1 sugar ABC transporter ATP-binding protein [Anaerolineaceae bacterium]HQH57385.1 sugar ABC transporter ATP-binding protein [Anaerolineaceae bacterium]